MNIGAISACTKMITEATKELGNMDVKGAKKEFLFLTVSFT